MLADFAVRTAKSAYGMGKDTDFLSAPQHFSVNQVVVLFPLMSKAVQSAAYVLYKSTPALRVTPPGKGVE